MKPIIILLISICAAVNASAQYTPPTCITGTQLICNNYPSYQYDAAGNRTSMYNFCYCGGANPRLAQQHSKDSTATTQTPENTSAAAPSPLGEDWVGATILRIFPNPTNSTVTVEFTAATTGTLRVSDAMGKQLGSFTVSGSNVTVDISAYPAGTYLLTLIATDRIDTQRVVKADN